MVSRHHTQFQNKGPIPENVGQDDLIDGPLVHEASRKRRSKPGHAENGRHGVKKTISYNPTDNHE